MTRHHRRGAAAIIAMIVLALTGMTVAAYVRADAAATTTDASAIPGYRAQYAAHAGLCCTIAWERPALTPPIPPQIAGAFDLSITHIGADGIRITAESGPSARSIDTTITRQGDDRPRITAWAAVGGHSNKSTKAKKEPPGQAKDKKPKANGPPESPGKSGESHGKASESNGVPGGAEVGNAGNGNGTGNGNGNGSGNGNGKQKD